MKMSTAAAKSNKPRDGEEKNEDGEQRRSRPQPAADDGFGSDDGFEVVTDKKRAGKPQFTRGSKF